MLEWTRVHTHKQGKLMNIPKSEQNKRDLGQYMTPTSLALQMVDKFETPIQQLRVLDPACGDGNLLLAVADRMINAGIENIHKRLVGVELDEKLLEKTRCSLSAKLDCDPISINLINANFLEIFDGSLNQFQYPVKINAIISNPPYGGQREYLFFRNCVQYSKRGTELVFLMPLAFIDRISGVDVTVIKGRPMGVTTGHVIVYHRSGRPYNLRSVMGLQANSRDFEVLTGLKLYQVGEGHPPQTEEIVQKKPYSSTQKRQGWIPCLRTGDVKPHNVRIGRLYVKYGRHLAHPKDFSRFTGPRVIVRRVLMWSTRNLGAVYRDDTLLCAGDMLIVRHKKNDTELLKGLEVYLNSREAALIIYRNRPSVLHRESYPKISAKDLNLLFEEGLPSDQELRGLGKSFRMKTRNNWDKHAN